MARATAPGLSRDTARADKPTLQASPTKPETAPRISGRKGASWNILGASSETSWRLLGNPLGAFCGLPESLLKRAS